VSLEDQNSVEDSEELRLEDVERSVQIAQGKRTL
jgi:hypothetical protein